MGGASTRRFFRVTTAEQRSAVAMYVPLPSQELSKAKETGRRWPFLEVRDLLADNAIRVPALLAEACEAGWLLVEDLGDTLGPALGALARGQARALSDAPCAIWRARNAR